MFSHLFLLNNKKYFVIHNNNDTFNLDDAINEYSKHSWILHNNQSFNSHIETKFIHNYNSYIHLINNYIDKYGLSNW